MTDTMVHDSDNVCIPLIIPFIRRRKPRLREEVAGPELYFHYLMGRSSK